MSIGENIKKIRKLRNMTQQELANSINLSRSYLGDLENDRRNPSMETIKKLAQNRCIITLSRRRNSSHIRYGS